MHRLWQGGAMRCGAARPLLLLAQGGQRPLR